MFNISDGFFLFCLSVAGKTKQKLHWPDVWPNTNQPEKVPDWKEKCSLSLSKLEQTGENRENQQRPPGMCEVLSHRGGGA